MHTFIAQPAPSPLQDIVPPLQTSGPPIMGTVYKRNPTHCKAMSHPLHHLPKAPRWRVGHCFVLDRALCCTKLDFTIKQQLVGRPLSCTGWTTASCNCCFMVTDQLLPPLPPPVVIAYSQLPLLSWMGWLGKLGELPWQDRPLCVTLRSVFFLRDMRCGLQLLLVSLRTPHGGHWGG